MGIRYTSVVQTKHSLKTKDSLKIFSKKRKKSLWSKMFFFCFIVLSAMDTGGTGGVQKSVLPQRSTWRADTLHSQQESLLQRTSFTALGDTALGKSSGAKKELLPFT